VRTVPKVIAAGARHVGMQPGDGAQDDSFGGSGLLACSLLYIFISMTYAQDNNGGFTSVTHSQHPKKGGGAEAASVQPDAIFTSVTHAKDDGACVQPDVIYTSSNVPTTATSAWRHVV
jgi:hypothetical protein